MSNVFNKLRNGAIKYLILGGLSALVIYLTDGCKKDAPRYDKQKENEQLIQVELSELEQKLFNTPIRRGVQSINLESIKDIVSSYTFGQYTLPQSDLELKFIPKTNQILLHNFYAASNDSKFGGCMQLMNTSYADIKEKHPEYHVFRVAGYDPNFFVSQYAQHMFLLVSEKSLMGQLPATDNPHLIKEILKHNPWIVDPTFGIVRMFNGSGYKVKAVFGEVMPIQEQDSILIGPSQSVPLGKNSSDELVFLGVDINMPSMLYIGFQKLRQEMKKFDLNSKDIDSYIKNKGLYPVIEYIKGVAKRDLHQIQK